MRCSITILLPVLFMPLAAIAKEVTIEFAVEAPQGTPNDAVLHLSGGHASLGNWSGSGLKLTRGDDGKWHGELKLLADQTVEFKVTRGGWQSVEKDARGGEIANRKLQADKDMTLRIKVARWADASPDGKIGAAKPTGRSTRTGDIRVHSGFESKALGNRRDVLVYLPKDYDKSDARYPVLYMHDGQNLFDASTSFLGIEWQADEHAEKLIAARRIPPIIIVGIANTPDRMSEYTMDRDEGRGAGGRGREYAKFLVEEIKPFIDKTYRTKPDRANTGVAGSSLGGLISLSICQKYPETFSMCGVISPALMWNDDAILKELDTSDISWMRRVRFWVDMGTAEGRQVGTFSEAISRTRRLVELLERAGLSKGTGYDYLEVNGGEHNEAAWAARFDRILLFFFGPTEHPK